MTAPLWPGTPCPLCSTSLEQQNEHEWGLKLFKTRSLTGMWWVRTSVSEESLCAPSRTRFPRKGRENDQGGVGLEVGKEEGGFSCHFKTNDWSPSWGLGQHRACWKREDFWAGAPVPKCPSSSLQVSFHHGVSVKHSGVRRRRKKAQCCKTNFDLLACVSPPVYNSFIPKDSGVCGSLRESRSHSLSLRLWKVSSTQQGRESHQLEQLRISAPIKASSPGRFPSAACSADRPDGDDGEDNALRGSIRWDAHSACATTPSSTTHTYGFSPHPSSSRLHFTTTFYHPPPPLPLHAHTHTHTLHLFRDQLGTQEGGGSPAVEPLFVEFLRVARSR